MSADIRPRIMVAPNGARRSPRDHPRLPISIEAVAAETAAAARAGAEAAHLHVRGAEGRHSLDPGLYSALLDAVADAAPGLKVQLTTEAAGVYAPQDQLACIEALRPAWASVSVREIAAAPALAPRFYATCADLGVRLQHILYDAADAALLAAHLDQGVVAEAAPEVLLVLGRYAPPTPADPGSLPSRIAPLSPSWRWSVCAFGVTEQATLCAAAGLGAEWLRVGFENNLENPAGGLWRDNAEAVASLRAALEQALEQGEAR